MIWTSELQRLEGEMPRPGDNVGTSHLLLIRYYSLQLPSNRIKSVVEEGSMPDTPREKVRLQVSYTMCS